MVKAESGVLDQQSIAAALCATASHQRLKLRGGRMQSLRAIAEELRPLGRHAAFYLAAAVSDFYIPWPQMVCALPPRISAGRMEMT